jgi:hypothetical protein
MLAIPRAPRAHCRLIGKRQLIGPALEMTSLVTGMRVPHRCAPQSQLDTGNDGFAHPVKALSLA